MHKGLIPILAAVSLLAATQHFAQCQAAQVPGNLPGVFTFIPRADVEKVQSEIESGQRAGDAPVRMVNAGNRFNLGVYTLNSAPSKPPAPGAPVMGFYHNDIAEIYIITSGSGYWRVGGELENPKVDDPNGRSVKEVRGPGVIGVLKGYTNQKISAGDVLIVPPGVPHSPGQMLERTKIIRVVVDPHKVLPLVPATGQKLAATPAPAPAKPAPKLAGTYTYIPKAQIDEVMKGIEKPGAQVDQPVRMVDAPAINYRLGLYVLHAAQMPKQPRHVTSGWYHNNITEIYYFPRGAGTFLIGGTLEDAKADDPNSFPTKFVRGPSVTGDFKGATELKFEAGDLIIAPPGVPHIPSDITAAPRDIERVVIDPDKVLPLK